MFVSTVDGLIEAEVIDGKVRVGSMTEESFFSQEENSNPAKRISNTYFVLCKL